MSRKAFEEWLNPGNHAGNVSPWVEPGRYDKETHQLAWLAWQAATDAALARAADVCQNVARKQGTIARQLAAMECGEVVRALKDEK